MGRFMSLTWIALEHICWDPKDGELCLNRVKPGETLVEARRHYAAPGRTSGGRD